MQYARHLSFDASATAPVTSPTLSFLEDPQWRNVRPHKEQDPHIELDALQILQEAAATTSRFASAVEVALWTCYQHGYRLVR